MNHNRPELSVDKQQALLLVKKGGYHLEVHPETFKNDKEVVIEEVSQNGYAIKYASEEARTNSYVAIQSIVKELEKIVVKNSRNRTSSLKI